MHIILGGTGRVGSALVRALLNQGEEVTVVTHRSEAVAGLKSMGAEVAMADAHDAAALHEIFQRGGRAYVLNPPADVAKDTVAEERHTVNAMINGLRGTSLEKVVAQSVYGAHAGAGKGDLNVLYELEEGLKKLAMPYAAMRCAYFMSNWDAALETARNEGVVYTLFPSDFTLPMVAPDDLGNCAAELMTSTPQQAGIFHAEGPERYSADDVAQAFAAALGKPVCTVVIPRADWVKWFKEVGFSDEAAASYAAMTAATIDDAAFPSIDKVHRGSITLEAYVAALVEKSV